MLQKMKKIMGVILLSATVFLNGCATDGSLSNEGKVALGIGGAILLTGLIAGAVAMSHTPKIDIDASKIHVG